jgi:uncharacterized protein YciI
MKYFLVLIEYKTALENIMKITDDHRSYLKQGYQSGILLISGPQVPRKGGVVVAKGESKEDIENFFSEDPYNKYSYADYKIIEFEPKSFEPSLAEWLNREG